MNKIMFSHIKSGFKIKWVKIITAHVCKFNMCTRLSFMISILDFDITYESNLNVYLYNRR